MEASARETGKITGTKDLAEFFRRAQSESRKVGLADPFEDRLDDRSCGLCGELRLGYSPFCAERSPRGDGWNASE